MANKKNLEANIKDYTVFTCYVEIDQFHKNFWFSSVDSETTKDTSDIFIHLNYSKGYNFNCSKLIDESEIFKKIQN